MALAFLIGLMGIESLQIGLKILTSLAQGRIVNELVAGSSYGNQIILR